MTAARSVACQFIGSGPGVLGAGRRGRPATRPRPSPAGPPPTRPSRSWSWSTAAAHRPARSSPARSRTPGAARSSASTTFGKGTVQQWQELTGEGGAFRLTIARWLTPDKRWIHDVGLTPDEPVEVPADAGPDDDPVLDRAVELLSGAGTRAEPRIAA